MGLNPDIIAHNEIHVVFRFIPPNAKWAFS